MLESVWGNLRMIPRNKQGDADVEINVLTTLAILALLMEGAGTDRFDLISLNVLMECFRLRIPSVAVIFICT